MSSNLTEQELTTVCFRDPQWLALNPLVTENVLSISVIPNFMIKHVIMKLLKCNRNLINSK
jgi:mediator of RNA polymerase II transcription subunit 6